MIYYILGLWTPPPVSTKSTQPPFLWSEIDPLPLPQCRRYLSIAPKEEEEVHTPVPSLSLSSVMQVNSRVVKSHTLPRSSRVQ